MTRRVPHAYGFRQHPNRDAVLMRSDLAHHAVVGFYTEAPRAGLNKNAHALSPMMAWLDLGQAIFVDPWYSDDPNAIVPVCYEFSGPASEVRDPSLAWNWHRQDARRFIERLHACGMISADLADVLSKSVGRRDYLHGQPARSLSPKLRASVWSKTNGHCSFCGAQLIRDSGRDNSFHVDHLFPVKNGATDDLALLVPSCRKCNLEKSSKTLVEFIDAKRADVGG